MTGKLLHISVHNKYCASYEYENDACFKNWSAPSYKMETGIILEGSPAAERVHCVKYTCFCTY